MSRLKIGICRRLAAGLFPAVICGGILSALPVFAEDGGAAAGAAAAAAEATAEAAAEAAASPVSVRFFIIFGVIISFVLAVILAVRGANKRYGKEW